MPIGPALPPHLAHLANGSASSSSSRSPSPPRAAPPFGDDEESDEDDFGPALPPHLAAARKAKTNESQPTAGPSMPSRVTLDSPSPPRIPAARQPAPAPTTYAADDDDDSDDDVIGPTLPTGEVKEKTAAEEFMEREARMKKAAEDKNKPVKQQREEWMLVPPSSGILATATDPLRKRPTTFSRTTKEVEIDSSVWTETPQEKAQRLADEVAGIKRKKAPKPGEGGDSSIEGARKRMRDEEIRASVEKHNKEMRGKSLLDQHASKAKDKDEAPAIWDHSRDMGITGRLLNDQERSQKIRDAAGLNDRFGHSKRGAYDM